MKKVLSLMVVVAIVLSVAFAGTTVAFAEDVVDWSASLSPSSLSTGGNITFSSTVKNISSNPITDVVIIYPDGSSHPIGSGTIQPGSSEKYSDAKYNVPTEQLDKDLKFTLKCTYTNASGQQASYEKYATGKVTKKAGEGNVKITGSTSVNKQSVEQPGDKVTLSFTFKNTGTSDATDCRLFADPILGGKEITRSPFTLAAGATKTLDYTTPISKTTTISPQLKYKADGKDGSVSTNTVTVALGDDPIVVPQEAAIEITAVPNTLIAQPGDDVEFSITVTNTGDADLENVLVSGSNGDSISLNKTSLAAGLSATGKVSYKVEEETSYAFAVSATDALGSPVKDETDEITIAVEEPADDPDVPKGLFIDVTAATQTLEEPGEVLFTITVSNTSDIELSNVVVSEASIGDIVIIPVLGTDVKTIEHVINVKQTTGFVFTVQAELEDGSVVTATTNPVTITVPESGIDMMMIAIIVAIAAAVVVIIVIIVLRKKKNNNNDDNNYPDRYERYDSRSQRPQNRSAQDRPMRQRTQQGAERPQRQRSAYPGDAEMRDQRRSEGPKPYNPVRNEMPTLDIDDEPKRPANIPVGVKAEPKEEYIDPAILKADPVSPVQARPVRRRTDRNNF